MKIIRRKRTIKIETCAFRQWQDEGTDSSFSCPNCGKTFGQNPELSAAIEKLLPEIVDEPKAVLALPEATETESACDEVCAEKL
jgi:transcription initiation factor IIE alpha subunit